ncbi:hypothetical protein BSK56_13850 [Paenibacillus borealis]|uniref:Uncharacterized protein n=1 Tax=Paenibacillus borealis TaxID=160799 RepID=A0ABX3H9V7_PAEBO|nr:hypothetical protein BSK56_13850 [Paenibacillus borealis]
MDLVEMRLILGAMLTILNTTGLVGLAKIFLKLECGLSGMQLLFRNGLVFVNGSQKVSVSLDMLWHFQIAHDKCWI